MLSFILKKRSRLTIIDGHSYFSAKKPGFADDFGINEFGNHLCKRKGCTAEHA